MQRAFSIQHIEILKSTYAFQEESWEQTVNLHKKNSVGDIWESTQHELSELEAYYPYLSGTHIQIYIDNCLGTTD